MNFAGSTVASLATQNAWYAIQTQPRRESVAEFHLGKTCESVFFPRYRQQVILHGYRREVERPLFPGYLFAAFDVRGFRAAHYAHGVRGVVRFGDEPAELPLDLLKSIAGRMRDGYVVLDPARLKMGQKVEIVDGPFAGYTAIFQEHWSGAERVSVLLDALRSRPRVIIDRAALRAIQ